MSQGIEKPMDVPHHTIHSLSVVWLFTHIAHIMIISNQPEKNKLLLLLLLLLLHFTVPWILSGITRVSQYQKGKTNLDLLEQEIVSGTGISWAICKCALHLDR